MAAETALEKGIAEPNRVFWDLAAHNLAKLTGSMKRSENLVEKRWKKILSEYPYEADVSPERKAVVTAAHAAAISFLMKEQPSVGSSAIFHSKSSVNQLCAPILDDTASNQSDDAFFEELQKSIDADTTKPQTKKIKIDKTNNKSDKKEGARSKPSDDPYWKELQNLLDDDKATAEEERNSQPQNKKSNKTNNESGKKAGAAIWIKNKKANKTKLSVHQGKTSNKQAVQQLLTAAPKNCVNEDGVSHEDIAVLNKRTSSLETQLSDVKKQTSEILLLCRQKFGI